jgi:hypothetical protein
MFYALAGMMEYVGIRLCESFPIMFVCTRKSEMGREGKNECDPKKILCAFFVRHAIAERYLSSFKVYGIKRMR